MAIRYEQGNNPLEQLMNLGSIGAGLYLGGPAGYMMAGRGLLGSSGRRDMAGALGRGEDIYDRFNEIRKQREEEDDDFWTRLFGK